MNEQQDNTESILSAVLYRASCPAPDQLLQYQIGALNMFEQKQVETHVAGCPHCSAEAAALKAIEAIAGSATLTLEQPSLLDRLHSWLAEQMKNRPLRQALQPVPQPSLALRGTGDTRHDFSTGDYRVSLSTSVAADTSTLADAITLSGTVVNIADPLTEFSGTVLVSDGTTVHETTVDGFGYFALDNLSSTTYAVVIDLPTQTLVIEAVDLTIT